MRQKFKLVNPTMTDERLERKPLLALRHDEKKKEMMIAGSNLFLKNIKWLAALPREIDGKRHKKSDKTNSYRYKVLVSGVDEVIFEGVKEELVREGWELLPVTSFGRLSW